MKKMNLEGKNIHFVIVEKLLERTMHIFEFTLCVDLGILFLHNSCKPLKKSIFNTPPLVATLALGLQPRQGFARLQAKKEAGSHTTYSRECEKV